MNRSHARQRPNRDRDRDPIFTKRALEKLGPKFLEAAADLNTMSIRVDQLAAELWDMDDTRFTWFDSGQVLARAWQLSDISEGLTDLVGSWRWLLDEDEAG